MDTKNTSIEEYLKPFPTEVQVILKKIRKMGHDIVKDAEETISYGIPTLKLNGKQVFYFAGYKNHISLYPIPDGPESFKKALESHITGKGTAQFQLDKPIPFDLIEQFIKHSLESFLQRNKK